MSDHSCPVVGIKLDKHPNADALSIIQVGGYQIVVRTEDWKDKKLGVFIPPDSVVPDTEQFAFLKGHNRIKVRKFRGIYSQGLLIPAPEDAVVGDNYADQLGITHYEPPIQISFNTDNIPGPKGIFIPKYDVENVKNSRFSSIIQQGDEVYLSEKIHGCNARFAYWDGKFWLGSRTNWKDKDDKNPWSIAINNQPEIEEWCRKHEGYILYGECYGQVQNLKYGIKTVRFAAFDIWDGKDWLEYDDAKAMSNNIPWVPELYRGPFNIQSATTIAESQTAMKNADHMREGVVIRPIPNKYDPKLGRVQLKLISNRYLEKL